MRHRVSTVGVLSLHYREESPRHFTAPVHLILQFLNRNKIIFCVKLPRV